MARLHGLKTLKIRFAHYLGWLALAACPAPAPTRTTQDLAQPQLTQPTPGGSTDAAVAATPDAEIPDAVTSAPAWVFRYQTPDRTETWTLRHAGGTALLEIATATNTTRYTGSAVEGGSSLALAVSTGTAKLSLECKPDTLRVGAKCNDVKAAPVEVLSCFHPDYKTPMPFGHAPGIEYIVDGGCSGYRLRTP